MKSSVVMDSTVVGGLQVGGVPNRGALDVPRQGAISNSLVALLITYAGVGFYGPMA